MADSQAGESSQAQQNKMPWEASFWGAVGETIKEVKEGLVGPSKPVYKPWESGFWEGKNTPPVPKVFSVKTESDMRKAVMIQPGEPYKDSTRQANLNEIDAEIRNTKNPTILKILKEERARIANAR